MSSNPLSYHRPIGRLRRLTGAPMQSGLFVYAGISPMAAIGVEILRGGFLFVLGPVGVALIWRTRAQMAEGEE
jgi:hypothetical protein